jgi:TPR repeat protein
MKKQYAAIVFLIAAVTSYSVLAQQAAPPLPNGPTEAEVRKTLDSMPPEKRAEALKQLSEVMSKLELLNDIESGKCTRAAEVNMKAIQGDPQSIYMQSEMYQKGFCLPADLDKFHANLEKAASLSVASASYDIGYYLSKGEGGYRQDTRLSRGWLDKAIQQGNEPRAMMMLGEMLLSGEGGPVDSARGIQLLERVANGSKEDVTMSNQALVVLSVHYLTGDVVPRNYATAQKFAFRAAVQCDARGMFLSAASYLYVDPPNALQAYAWANVATAHGQGDIVKKAINIRQDAQSHLSQEDILNAQHLSSTLKVCIAH